MNNHATFDQNFIDLSASTTPADVLFKIGNIIENNNLRNKKVKLDLGNISFSHAHIYGLRSILESSGIEIEGIFTSSQNTQSIALSTGIVVLENSNDEVSEENNPEIEDKEIEQQEIISEDARQDSQNALEEALENALNKDLNDKNIISQEKIAPENKNYQTLYLKQTLRSGQNVDFDGNVFIIGDCHPGSEITAAGDIIVWGLLSGVAHAGSKGNNQACIRAFKINAIQIRIANIFARKPDRLMLEKNERTASFTPEEAIISDGEIKIYS